MKVAAPLAKAATAAAAAWASYLSPYIAFRCARQLPRLQSRHMAAMRGHRESDQKFIDYTRVVVCGGRGGNGCVSWVKDYRHRKFPTGADGGRGGDVLFVADDKLCSLDHLKPVIRGNAGSPGGSNKKLGANARDTYIKVPAGTLIYHEGEVIADLAEEGQTVLVAQGGQAGRGNTGGLQKTQALDPACEEALGQPGQEMRIEVEVKTIADVGLVGLPNAGKSSFLRAVSRAHPRVAPYPFTTMSPHLGVVDFEDYYRMRVADVPGLIRGASQNQGLGHEFLRHIERNAMLLFVLDMSGENGSPHPIEAFSILKEELEQYRPGLSKRHAVIAANKMDRPQAYDMLHELADVVQNIQIVPIIATEGKGVKTVTKLLRRHIEAQKKKEK